MIAPEPRKVLQPVPTSSALRKLAWCPGEGPGRPSLRVASPRVGLDKDRSPLPLGPVLPALDSSAEEREGLADGPVIHAPATKALRELLDPFPQALAGLRAQGVSPDPTPGEALDPYLNRMGTALMALYRDSGERESFNALYAFTRDSILAWIKSLLARGNHALDPNELLQDTFVNVYRYPRSFRDERPGSFRVWARTIAGNLIRRAGSQRARCSFQALPDGLQEPADFSQNPATLAAAVDESRILMESWNLFLMLYAEAWKELSQRDRRTLHLVEVEGLSYEEAGQILGVGRSNMKMIVFRSRKRIARRIERVLAASRLSASGLEVA